MSNEGDLYLMSVMRQIVGRLSLMIFISCGWLSFSFAQSNSWAGSSNSKPSRDSSAKEQCGQDRRCRLERLKLLNQKRKRSQAQGQDRRALKYQDNIDKKYLRITMREQRPLLFDLDYMMSDDFSGSGIAVSWHWLKHLRLNASYVFECSLNGSFDYDTEYNFNGRCYKGGVRYLFGTKNFSSYIEAYGMQMVVDGDIYMYNNNGAVSGGGFEDIFDFTPEPQFTNDYVEGELEAHLLGLGTGFDWQTEKGFHLRAGVSTHYVLFASLRDKRSRANLTNNEIESFIVDDALALIFDFSLGYAF